MLQSIRDRAQGLLAWIVVIIISIPFALWGIHGYLDPRPQSAIAEVNGIEVSQNEFDQNLKQRRQIYAMLKQPFDEAQIKQSILDRLVDEEVLVQVADTAKMRIGDALLSQRIHELFQREGQFVQEQYEREVRNRGYTTAGYEAQMRRTLLTEQFRDGVVRSALLTAHDKQSRMRLEKQQRLLSYVLIPASRFNDSVVIDDDSIQEYYDKHIADYQTPEKVSIEYVEFSQDDLTSTLSPMDEETLKQRYEEQKENFITPAKWHARHILVQVAENAPPADVEAAQKKAQEMLAKIRAGESFEAVAKLSDDKANADNGGDLGWFGPGEMVDTFEDVLNTLSPGQLSEVVRTKFGFHIIKLEEAQPETIRSFADVRGEIEKALQQEQLEQDFREKTEQFANLAYEQPDNLDMLAQVFKLQKKTSDLFDRNGVPDKNSILSQREVIDMAFSDTVLKEGKNSDIVELDNRHVVVLRLQQHQPAESKPLADVKDSIVSTLKKEKMQQEAHNLGKTLIEQVQSTGDPDAVMKTAQLNWSPAQWVEVNDTTLKQPLIVREAFKLGRPSENTAFYRLVDLTTGDYAVVAVLSVKEEIPPENLEDKKVADALKQAESRLQMAVGDSEFRELVSSLKTKAEIKVYRDKVGLAP